MECHTILQTEQEEPTVRNYSLYGASAILDHCIRSRQSNDVVASCIVAELCYRLNKAYKTTVKETKKAELRYTYTLKDGVLTKNEVSPGTHLPMLWNQATDYAINNEIRKYEKNTQ